MSVNLNNKAKIQILKERIEQGWGVFSANTNSGTFKGHKGKFYVINLCKGAECSCFEFERLYYLQAKQIERILSN